MTAKNGKKQLPNNEQHPSNEPPTYAQLVEELSDPQPIMTVDMSWQALTGTK